MQRTLTVLVLICALPFSVQARTWYVKADQSGDAPTIQAAVDSTVAGDSILVAPGTYGWSSQGTGTQYGMIHIRRGQNDFVLRSEAGPLATVLDGEYRGRVFFIDGWNNLLLEGFTIRRGQAPSFGDFTGGGIATHLSFDTVRNCIFRDNIASYGGALWCGGVSAMQIEDCQFINNNASAAGGAVYLVNSSQSPTFRNTVFRHNTSMGSGGALYANHNGFHLENCLIVLNEAALQGGAIYARDVWPSSITACTIADNEAPSASAFHFNACPSMVVTRTIVARNGAGVAMTTANASVMTLGCSDIFGNTDGTWPPGTVDAGDNFSLDPLFCGSPASLNYAVSLASPCAPGAHPENASCGVIGAVAPACQGSVTTKPVTWGGLKALYR
jgi:predicted outer membrane repeat protein